MGGRAILTCWWCACALLVFTAGQDADDQVLQGPDPALSSKPGKCPPVNKEFLYSEKECQEAVSDCNTDSDCFGSQKCCDNGCAKLCTKELQTGCLQLQNLFKRQARALGREFAEDQFIPRCREGDGQFENVQCNNAQSNCWCVDSQGLELAGTRARALALVNCTTPKKCASYLCRMLCPYGFELDEDGCPLCECRNPCKAVSCPAGQECSVEETPCSDPNCPPLPTCKRPRKLSHQCPFGEPLVSPDTNNPFLCGLVPNKPQCPINYLCNVLNGSDYGICCPLHEKPGECPKEEMEDACGSPCEMDMHCEGTSKCCDSQRCGKSCIKPGNTTLCQQQKQVVELLIRGNPNYEAYIPQCDDGGEFYPKQCTANGRLCWCVDEKGTQIRGSLGPAPSVQCTVESREAPSSLLCPTDVCDLNCTLGYKTDENGCQLCECYDPCKEISCPEDATCVVMKEDPCGSGHCPPIATCMRKNRPTCGQGSPLTNPATGEAVQCSGQDGCPVTHKCQLLPEHDNGICCPLLESFATDTPNRESSEELSCPSSVTLTEPCENTTCSSDQDCSPGMKCCASESCGNICVTSKHSRLPTMCEYLREMGMKLEGSGEKQSLAVPIPTCRPDGSYEPIQCDQASSECWCVDEFGSELRNTRARRGEVDCREVRALRNCLGLLCRLGCDYGFEMDEDGCPYCECRNPCSNARCGAGMECQMQTMPCDSYWCPPIPQCMEVKVQSRASFPSCPVGRPLMFEENDRPVTCSPLETYQQCPDTHMCVAESMDGPGICCPRIVINEENVNEASESRKEEEFNHEKEGQCPYLVPLQTQNCDFNCQADSDCAESHKCCSNGCGTQCTTPQMLTACQHQRQILDLRAREKGVPASHTHLPVCMPDGSFAVTQCDPVTSSCWCVDENGFEVPGTRAPASQTINCTNPVKCYPTECNLDCPHGLEMGLDGCYMCACRDPCKDVKCSGPKEECRSVQVNCVTKPCPPVALCLPPMENPCPFGEPLVNLSSGLAQECGPLHESCPSSHKCHLSPIGEYAVCCLKPREVCYQEPDPGMCKASIPRWFFNSRKNTCEQFMFGGCAGNMNNFQTKEDCMATCPVMSQCERIRERNLKIKKTVNKVVFLPKCNRQTGVWEPVQCLDNLGLCWCVDKEGDQIPGSVVRGTPTCNARAARNMGDISICPSNEAVYLCPEDMCAHAACIAYPNATCRINPCDGCRPEFFDEKNRKVNCREKLTACLDEVQRVLDSPAWLNQAKSSLKVSAEFADSSESQVLDDGSIPLPPSYLPPPPPLPPSLALTLQRQGLMGRVEESVHHETAIIAQEMTQDATPTGGIRSHLTIVMTPRIKGFSLRIPDLFSPLSRMISDMVPDEIQQVFSASKPGVCPTPSMMSLLLSMSWRCEHRCASDRHCPGSQKCCVGQCGLECMYPDLVADVEDREASSDSTGIQTANDIDEPLVMMAMVPNCSAQGGYAITQRQGELSWCVDKYGRPHHDTLTRGTVRCSRNGTITYKEELGPVCSSGDAQPKVCRNECLNAYCPQNPEAVCVTDPCQDCAVSFINSQGEKVECEDKCLQTMQVGRCGGLVERFYFNQATQRCQAFNYSGCQGNDNNFQSLQECQASCQQPKPVCEQLKDVGLCRARIPRWFYNKHTHTCEEFQYGGCGGNNNNFATKQECLARCPDVVFCHTTLLTSELTGCSRSSLCANVTCPGNTEAVCTVDPCLCKAIFVDAQTGNSVECQPSLLEPEIMLPLITSETRCQHLRSKNTIEHTSSSSYMAQCTSEGHFEPTQCATDLDSNKEECWCVDEVGIQLPDSDTFTRQNAKCRMVRIQRVEVTMGLVPENESFKVSKDQVKSLTKRLLSRLSTTADDNMEVAEANTQLTKVTFSLSDRNKVDATFKLEQMVKTGSLMLQTQDGRLVADYRSSHFYHISDFVPQDVEVFDNVIRETHMAINAASVARDNTITLVAAMLVITVVIVLLLLAAVMFHRRKLSGNSSNTLVSLAFSSPIYGFITRKSQTKTNPYDSVKKKPEAAIQTVEGEYESIQNQINKEKEPDSPPPSYKAIDETKIPEKV